MEEVIDGSGEGWRWECFLGIVEGGGGEKRGLGKGGEGQQTWPILHAWGGEASLKFGREGFWKGAEGGHVR